MATLPPLNIPASTASVKVSVIDIDCFVSGVSSDYCMSPVYSGMESYGGPVYCFLITHEPSQTSLIFDLGIPKDYKNRMSAEDLFMLTEKLGMKIRVGTDVATVLTSNGIDLNTINTIIWSHHHWDHIGTPSNFPESTIILVGSGFKDAYLPGYPTDPKGDFLSDPKANHEIKELDFSAHVANALEIGPYRAVDYFGDGSFYLLDTPGHTIGHISALARTTARDGEEPTFIFLGGDIAHHAAVFRPTKYLPIPQEIYPSPFQKPHNHSSCPGKIFAKIHHRYNDPDGEFLSHTTPFGKIAGPEHDLAEAQRSVEKMMPFDGRDNILTIFAHDKSLMDVLEYFPKSANDWHAKGWRREGLWRFLPDLLREEQRRELMKV